MLNSVSAIELGAHALRDSWGTLSVEQREHIIGVVADQAAHVRGVLQDLIRGLPVELLDALDGVSRRGD